jgi:hypothetical protein
VSNQAPRILDVEVVPTSLERGQSAVINVEVYDGHGVDRVQLDLREYGGEVVNMTSEDGLVWAAMVEMPIGMNPGHRSMLIVATDDLGATTQQRFSTPVDEVGSPVFGPHHVASGAEMPIEIHILNDRPVLVGDSVRLDKNPDEQTVYTIKASDPDGVERVQIRLGVFAPIGGGEWAMMHDDGVNGGDEVAGDGTYSVLLSVRGGTPLGTHQVSLRAFDVYGEMNTGSAVITLAEPDAPGVSEGGLSTMVLGALGLVVFLGAVAVLSLMLRRGGGGEGGDRFGMQ